MGALLDAIRFYPKEEIRYLVISADIVGACEIAVLPPLDYVPRGWRGLCGSLGLYGVRVL